MYCYLSEGVIRLNLIATYHCISVNIVKMLKRLLVGRLWLKAYHLLSCNVLLLLLVIPDLINKLASAVDAAVSGARAKSPTSQCATPKSSTDFDSKSSSSLDHSANTRDLSSPTPDSLRRCLTLVNEPSDQVEMTTLFEVNLAIGF